MVKLFIPFGLSNSDEEMIRNSDDCFMGLDRSRSGYSDDSSAFLSKVGRIDERRVSEDTIFLEPVFKLKEDRF